MSFIETVLIGVGLGMDAFSASISKGLSLKNINLKKVTIIGLYFGGFQALMPILGYLLGNELNTIIYKISNITAFLLMISIGIRSIWEATKGEKNKTNNSISVKEMLLLSLATSIDAFTVGITFSILKISIWKPAIIIGIVTFIMASIGTKIGKLLEYKVKEKAEILGGVILIIMGIKFLIPY